MWMPGKIKKSVEKHTGRFKSKEKRRKQHRKVFCVEKLFYPKIKRAVVYSVFYGCFNCIFLVFRSDIFQY